MGSTLSLEQTGSDGPSTSASACPVPEEYRSKAVYNVYNQRLDSSEASGDRYGGWLQTDPRNQMPSEPNQQPCPGQRKLLPTARVASGIPKGGTDGTWLYPSPQMFYNGKVPPSTCVPLWVCVP